MRGSFDGANKDQGNVKLSDDEYPKGLDLRGEDFTWLTEQVVAIANICCNGRVSATTVMRTVHARNRVHVTSGSEYCLTKQCLTDCISLGGWVRRAAVQGQGVAVRARALSVERRGARAWPDWQTQVIAWHHAHR